MSDIQTKSKDRVGKFGEVYTPEHIVKDMLDLIKEESYSIESTILEPSCGTGRFLVEILRRKLSQCKTDIDIVKSVSTIYGVDIIPDNIRESKEAMLNVIKEVCGESTLDRLYSTLEYIIDKNIVLGDTLKGVKLKTISNRGFNGQNNIVQPTVEDGVLTMFEWRFDWNSMIEPVEFSLGQPDLELKKYSKVDVNHIVNCIEQENTSDISDEYNYDDIL